MDTDTSRATQAPLKQRYRDDPSAALVTLRAEGELGADVSCSVATHQAMVEAGLHPATGGDGMAVCSGDMLFQALVACAGATLRAEGDLLFDVEVPEESRDRLLEPTLRYCVVWQTLRTTAAREAAYA